MCDSKVGLSGVEHRETVMMFGCEDHVFHAGIFCGIGPGLGVEFCRVELFVEVEVHLHEFFGVFSGLGPLREVLSSVGFFVNDRP